MSHEEHGPTLFVDGGSGLQCATMDVDGAPFVGTILLGHLHWDHTHGLPFFSGGTRPGSRVHVLCPSRGTTPRR